ncbi:lamin tail domain-containing protein [Candidatus Peregrinibacteria bacterium]|nr:lamin tail domain-containing protein [Candidatus Peregrinibacteria bacterium]
MKMTWLIIIALVGYVPDAIAAENLSVVISEVMWMGSDLSSADEWVEIFGNEPMSLSGWTLSRLKDEQEETIIRFGNTFIGSGQYILISNYSADESRLAADPLLVTTNMVLANTKLLLRLRDQEGNLIDSADDGVGDPFAGSNTDPKASMERISLIGSGGLKNNWQAAILSLGFDSGTLIFGTPGNPNSIVENEQINDSEIQLESFNKLKITEVLSDPVGSDTDGEWIEIANTGSGALNIGGLLLGVGEGGTFVLPERSLGSGEYLALDRSVTGLSLRNAGDIVRLLYGEMLIDSVEYSELPEGISYGRLGESFQSFCIPTKGKANAVILPDPVISVQSGETHAPLKVTINLEARVSSGSLTSAKCSWDYSDGYTSDSCNPPSHTFRTIGRYDIHLSVKDYCSNTVERILEIEVLETGVYQEASYNFDGAESTCTPSVSTGTVITDFIPNPVGSDKGRDPTPLSEACEGELCGVGEWIELKNSNSYSANLCGWVLDDSEGGSKPFPLDSVRIEPGGLRRLSIQETKIALNNGGDSVRLLFNGNLVQEIAYSEIPEGQSYMDRSEFGAPPSLGEGREGGIPFTGTILINEVYPAPLTGGEEWIELVNLSDESVDLSGLLIDDIQEGGSKLWEISDGTLVPAHSYIIFRKEQTHLALNNDGDEVNLFGPDGLTIDSVTYPKIKRGLSFSRKGSRWCTTEISTPLKENICSDSFSLRSTSPIGGGLRRGAKEYEEKSLYEALKSNSRSNNIFNILSLKTIYQHILLKSHSKLPEVTSPFLAEVLEMADHRDIMVSKNTHGDMWESLLVAVSLLSGLWFVFGGRSV